jgi:signal transduction histidine kinase/CheY-like chemotaxis protein
MRIAERQHSRLSSARSVAGAALLGGTRQQLIQAAVEHLLEEGQADRVGAWTEFRDSRSSGHQPAEYRGLVSDYDGEFTPSQWSHLSPEAPLPVKLLNERKTVEQELDHSSNLLVIGAVAEMRRALWVPISYQGQLRGVVLGAVRKRQGGLLRNVFESVADQLALALEFEDEQQRSRERIDDLKLAQRFLPCTNVRECLNGLLKDVVGDVTPAGEPGSGLGASFAVFQLTGESLGQRWCAGEDSRLPLFESEAVGRIWRKAIATGRTYGEELAGGRRHGDLYQVIAVPLVADQEAMGVFVAGWATGKQSPHVVGRLELRAAIAADVLSRSQSAQKAQRGESWITAVLLASDEAIILLGAGTEIQGMSRGARELTDVDLRQPIKIAVSSVPGQSGFGPTKGLHFPGLFQSSDRGKVATWLRESTAANRDAHALRAAPVDAQLHNGVNVRALEILASDDGCVAIRLDKKTERHGTSEITQAEAELLAVVEWLEEGVLVFDAERNVRAINGRFTQMAGLAPDDASRFTTLNQLVDRLSQQAAEPKHFAEHWHKLAHTDAATREEVQLLLPVPRVLERSARPVLDAAGRRSGWVEIYRDLTSQRVFQSKLLQTEKLAALGQMLTGVAHKLNNPLTSILGYAQRLLIRTEGSVEASQISQEAERAATIVRQLLSTARDTLPGRNSVCLNEVIERTLELQRFSLAAERVSMELDLNPQLPPILGDAGQLQQVLMNLMGNARQAIDQTGAGGTISIRTYVSDRGLAAIEVGDDGPGIPETIRARIFDPFFTTKPPGIGTGLGLAIVLGIVREHGGHVEVSGSGGGATFTLEFPPISHPKTLSSPVAPSREKQPDFAQAEASSLCQTTTDLADWSGAHILVIEDEPTVARLIADVLEDCGIQVDIVLNGRDAVQQSTAKSYAAVICDIKMPEMDGPQIYQAVVRATGALESKFLFVTGDAAAAPTHDFLKRYRLPYLSKPFRVEELIEKVLGVLVKTPV